jgi:hypothetical protein
MSSAAAGHVVHAPDLYNGKTFTTLADGVASAAGRLRPSIERGRLRRGQLAD